MKHLCKVPSKIAKKHNIVFMKWVVSVQFRHLTDADTTGQGLV